MTSETAEDHIKKLKGPLEDFSCALTYSCQSTLLRLTCTELPDTKKPEEIILRKFQWWNQSQGEKQRSAGVSYLTVASRLSSWMARRGRAGSCLW